MADLNQQQLDDLLDALEHGTGFQPTVCPPVGGGGATVPPDFAATAVNAVLGTSVDLANVGKLDAVLQKAFPDSKTPATTTVPANLVGTQAVLATTVQALAPEALARLRRLKPLNPCSTNCQGYQTLIPLIANALTELTEALSGPSDSYLFDAQAIVQKLDGDEGLLAELGRRLGIDECVPCSREQEQTATDFAICASFITMCAQLARANVIDHFVGNELQIIREGFDYICAQMKKLDLAISRAEAEAIELPDSNVPLGRLFYATRRYCRHETAENLEASGCDGFRYELEPTVAWLMAQYKAVLDFDGDDDCGLGRLVKRRAVNGPLQEIYCALGRIDDLVKRVNKDRPAYAPPRPAHPPGKPNHHKEEKK